MIESINAALTSIGHNISKYGSLLGPVFLLTFLIAFFTAPWVGKLAKRIGAYDLPARMRSKRERGFATRIHDYVYPKLGGLAVVIALFTTLVLTNNLNQISKGVILGIIIITVTGFLDDVFEVNSKVQLFGQVLAAFVVVITGITITSVNILNIQIPFNWISGGIEILNYTYHFIFPADLITILWIVGMINVINWVGGVDALNGSVTSIALFTLILITIVNGNIAIAVLMAVHLGGVLGVLPYNYNPGKIMYGSIGDYLNGFLLAIFAILGTTKWTATLIVLAMPIIDGILVIYMRFKSNPELLKSPLKILQISDKNHLHHRLLAAGYSKKTVTLVESAIMVVICSIVLILSDISSVYLAVILAIAFMFVAFVAIFFLMKRNENKQRLRILQSVGEKYAPSKEAVIKVMGKEEKDSQEEKFIY